MLIYLDTDFRCYPTENENTTQSVETSFFDGKCDTYIECYRFVPSGQTWTRPDGTVFTGEMVAPAEDWKTLDDAQREYEHDQYQTLAAENAALTADLAALDEEYRKGVDSL